jgi:hypothetical protein
MTRAIGKSCSAAFAMLFVALLMLPPPPAAAADPTEYGVDDLNASLSTSQAGAHADFTVSFGLKTDPQGELKEGVRPPYAHTKDLRFQLPPGILGNPENFPQCTTAQLEGGICPQDSQVGVTDVVIYAYGVMSAVPVFLMEPTGAGVVARLGFRPGGSTTILNLRVRPEAGYGLEAAVENANASVPIVSAETTLWGVPTDPVHDPKRRTVQEGVQGVSPPGGGRATGLAPTPFLTNPTRCGVDHEITVRTDSYQLPGQFKTVSAPFPTITGCGKLSFFPSFRLKPTQGSADSPSGMDAELIIPQEGLSGVAQNATPHLKRVEVTLPEGLALNPASAKGLGACSKGEVGLISESPLRFNGTKAACPDASKVGTVEILTPVLAGPIEGALYLATPHDNPFHTLLAGYLVAEGHGVTVKLAGRFELDPSGRITAVFDENPETPFERLRLHFKSGPQGVLTTPVTCGNYDIESSLSSWSASDPAAPTPAEIVRGSSPFAISSGPDGGACPQGGFSADLAAGTTDPSAGGFSSFVLRLTREDGTQRLRALELTMPTGLTGKLAGIPYCPEEAIGQATARSGPGQGGLELALPSCPAASRLGTVTTGLGSGPDPLFVSTGQVYLAGPYKGAPLSLAILAPALAGPFDLGNVVVRTALRVDPGTAQITAISDPIPTVLDGIPLDLRDLRVVIDRREFMLNPTSCAEKSFSGHATSDGGSSASLKERFQAVSCGSLAFKPKVSLRLKGPTNRGAHPALRAVVSARKGDAGLSRASVTLPHSQFIDQAHIKNPCTRIQFQRNECPANSVLGRATVYTPLLDQPLSGPVYFRSNGGERLLPDIVLDLHGQIDLVQVGFVDSVKARIRTTFASVPDAPFSRVVLDLRGGRKGLLQNSEGLCLKKQRARVRMGAQNGLSRTFTSTIRTPCRSGGKHAPRRGRSR